MLIRALVVLSPDQTWHVFRQSQWMAHLRRDISAANWPKLHFDISENDFLSMLQALAEWQKTPPEEINRVLERFGAVTIASPGKANHQD